MGRVVYSTSRGRLVPPDDCADGADGADDAIAVLGWKIHVARVTSTSTIVLTKTRMNNDANTDTPRTGKR